MELALQDQHMICKISSDHNASRLINTSFSKCADHSHQLTLHKAINLSANTTCHNHELQTFKQPHQTLVCCVGNLGFLKHGSSRSMVLAEQGD